LPERRGHEQVDLLAVDGGKAGKSLNPSPSTPGPCAT